MRNLLALVGLLVVVGGAVGWYCGWYKLSVSRGQEGNLQIQTEVDTHKVSDDLKNAAEKVGHMVGDKPDNGAQPVSPPVSTPGPVDQGRSASFPGGWPLKSAKPVSSGSGAE